jgi:hypothetical protein
MVHPHPGATSTKYSSLLMSSISYNTKPPNLIVHRTKYLRNSLDPSSFPYNTNPSIVSHRDLHSALQVLHKMHKSLQYLITQIQLLALYPTCTKQSPSALSNNFSYFLHFLSIYTLQKVGLSVGEPMGQHPFPITLTQNPKRTQKGV